MPARSAAPRGFTLLEVMVGLALLGFALVVLMRSAAGNIVNAEQSHMLGIATDLARGKMYDIEELLLKDGFSDTDHQECKDFSDEGWPNIQWCETDTPVDMPNFDDLQAMAAGQAKAKQGGSGAGSGTLGSAAGALGSAAGALGSAAGAFGSDAGSDADSGALGAFQNSMLGGMLGMMSGGKDILGAQAGVLLQMQYQMFQQILKVSIRKVTLKVSWKALGRDDSFTVVAFFTDPSAMDRVLNGLGSVPLSGTGSGSGSATGTGTTGTTGTTTTGKPVHNGGIQ